MLILLRVWSAFMAVVFAAVETHLNLTVYHRKPLPILLPYYVISVWLFAGALFPRHGSQLLVSGWGVTLGHTYLVYVENLLLRDSSPVLLTALRNTTIASVVALVVANYCARASAHRDALHDLTPVMRVMGVGFGAFVLIGQIFTSWGQGKPSPIQVPYFVLAALLMPLAFIPRVPTLVLSVWSVAFGFFYAELAGFLVFFDRPWHIDVLAGIGAVGAAMGVVLQSVGVARCSGRLVPPLVEIG